MRICAAWFVRAHKLKVGGKNLFIARPFEEGEGVIGVRPLKNKNKIGFRSYVSI